MSSDNPKAVVIAIDTNSYAGDFEREMCAWITGRIGECRVGEEYADEAEEQLKNGPWYEAYVIQEKDEHGCSRPCGVWATPGWFNNGTGGHFRDDSPEAATVQHKYPAYQSVAIFTSRLPTDEVLSEIRERALSFSDVYMDTDAYAKPLQVTGIRVLKPRKSMDTIISVTI